jgi:hypothetical protein
MPASFINDDLGLFFDGKDFGETETVLWNGVVVENVIFDDEDVEVSMGEGVGEIVPQPTLTGRTDDFTGIRTDDPVTIRGESFTVKNWKNDGTGMIEIFLTRENE